MYFISKEAQFKAVIKNFFRSKGVVRLRTCQLFDRLFLQKRTHFILYITVLDRQQYITNNEMYFINTPEKITKDFSTELQHIVIISVNTHVG